VLLSMGHLKTLGVDPASRPFGERTLPYLAVDGLFPPGEGVQEN